ncbi:MAG: dihydropteroate synthase [Rhodospirillaceae bacterium]|nr:dihydropteroate synthase [Rhodospirillaceae bacterium]
MKRVYVTPRGLLNGPAARAAVDQGRAQPFLGGQAFTTLEETIVAGGSITHAIKNHATLPAVAQQRPAFAGLSMDRPRLMGVLNVTPDSFSDGGKFTSVDAAIAHGVALLEQGADIIDLGGESTRPGATPVDPDEEGRRVVPVVRALADKGAKVSIDTRNAKTMGAAIAAGAGIVNDITALADPRALEIVAKSTASVILMHMQGRPGTMQASPQYVWAPGDVFDFLKERIDACTAKNISLSRLSVDPGFGFGKTDAHSAALFDHMALFHGLGCALTIGVSRKSFISRVSRNEGADQRLPGSLAGALYAAGQGAQIIRVHDVAETRQALAVWAHVSGA